MSSDSSVRLGCIEGDRDKANDVIYRAPNCPEPSGYVVFFGGDMQDYKENMLLHRDNKHYVQWDLESTAELIHSHFPEQAVLVIKPCKMALKTFSCYENFLTVNNFGAPTYEKDTDSLKHLRSILLNVFAKLPNLPSHKPLTIIGFSKGCVVLNQLLYSLHALRETPDESLQEFACKIVCMYWLEGGHSGTSSTWITDKCVLQSFASFAIETLIHVTPYQVHCDTRPRIGKEEKIFRETLRRLNVNVTRKLHFENEPRSIDMHFQVLKVFK